MDWRAKVELFEEIRREYEFGVGTIVGVAKKLGVHRRMVREAIGSALPSPRKRTQRPRWKLKAAVEFVDAIQKTAFGTRRALITILVEGEQPPVKEPPIKRPPEKDPNREDSPRREPPIPKPPIEDPPKEPPAEKPPPEEPPIDEPQT